LFPLGISTANIEEYLQTICTPDACTIASSCETVSAPFYDGVGFPASEKCCKGIVQGQPCLPAGVLVETCKESSSCIPNGVFESNQNVCSVPSKASTQWIGIVLALVGAAITNMGLNLQKFALRKRHEKVVKKKERERLGLFYRLTSLKISLSNFYKNMSNTSLTGRREGSVSEKSEHVTTNPTVSDRTKHLQSLNPDSGPSGTSTPRTVGAEQSASRLSTLKSYTAPDADKQQFQTSIGFGGLFKNPVSLCNRRDGCWECWYSSLGTFVILQRLISQHNHYLLLLAHSLWFVMSSLLLC
jgi:hypothetical protein